MQLPIQGRWAFYILEVFLTGTVNVIFRTILQVVCDGLCSRYESLCNTCAPSDAMRHNSRIEFIFLISLYQQTQKTVANEMHQKNKREKG